MANAAKYIIRENGNTGWRLFYVDCVSDDGVTVWEKYGGPYTTKDAAIKATRASLVTAGGIGSIHDGDNTVFATWRW